MRKRLVRAWSVALACTIAGFLTVAAANGADAADLVAMLLAFGGQGWGIVQTGRALSDSPHRHWHPMKIVLLWVLVAAICAAAVSLTGNWVAVAVLGGAAAIGVVAVLTWTWLSSREEM